MTTDKPTAWLAQVRFPKEEWRTYTVHLNYADAAHWQTPPDAAVERRVIPLYGGDELDRLREDRDAFRASSDIRGEEIERLTARVAELEQQRDTAIAMLADWCIAVRDNGTGWDDWDEHYKNACYRPGPLRELIDAALAKDGA